MSASTVPGSLLSDRYHVVGSAGKSPFGQSFLAKDLDRANELWLLHEFCPPQADPAIQEGLRQSFNQEASRLFELQHPQLPQVRPLMLTNDKFYLPRQYVPGQNYAELLAEGLKEGLVFSESEVLLLLFQILPVLDYLHQSGVVHSNLSPTTLIRRQTDQLPVPINLGLLKWLVVRWQLHSVPPQTPVWQWGYAPPEQYRADQLSPSCDLFALAMTAITLLTGQTPQELFDRNKQRFYWKPLVNLHPQFVAVLEQMLHPQPSHRLGSVAQVIQGLEPLWSEQFYRPAAAQAAATAPPVGVQRQEAGLLSADAGLNPAGVRLPPRSDRRLPLSQRDPLASSVLAIALTLLVAVLGWRMLAHVPKGGLPIPNLDPAAQQPSPAAEAASEPATEAPSSNPAPASPVSPEVLRQRQKQLGLDFQFFTGLVDEQFYAKYPQLSARTLASEADQGQYQAEWNAIANQLMTQLETLTPETRSKLGSYRRVNYDQWLSELGEAGAPNSPVLDGLADSRFYQLFPDLKGKPINPRTFGQIWYALAEEQLAAAKAQKAAGNSSAGL